MKHDIVNMYCTNEDAIESVVEAYTHVRAHITVWVTINMDFLFCSPVPQQIAVPAATSNNQTDCRLYGVMQQL